MWSNVVSVVLCMIDAKIEILFSDCQAKFKMQSGHGYFDVRVRRRRTIARGTSLKHTTHGKITLSSSFLYTIQKTSFHSDDRLLVPDDQSSLLPLVYKHTNTQICISIHTYRYIYIRDDESVNVFHDDIASKYIYVPLP
jgi:hypothetical protein